MTTEALEPSSHSTSSSEPPAANAARRAQPVREPPEHHDAPLDDDGQPMTVHEYDGIIEHDNSLPRWWLYTLYATVVFAIGYWFHYHSFGTGASPRQRYEAEMASVYAAEAARLRAAGAITDDALRAMSRDPATVAQGQQVFSTNCASCHGAAGGGQIGPNLTDAFWINGGAPTRIFRTVNEGQTQRGMPAWGPQLGNDRVTSVVAYLLTIKNTNVAGRPPQGEREE